MTTIFSSTIITDDGGAFDTSYRTVLQISGNVLTQVRVTLKDASGVGFSTGHVSIGAASGTAGDTTATPTEITFSGASGCTAAANASIVSDWINFTGPTSGQGVVVILDYSGGHASVSASSGALATWFKASTNSWNVATVSSSGYTSDGTVAAAVSLLETQGGAIDDRAPQNGALVATTLFRERLSGLLEPVRELWRPKRPEFVF